MVVVSGTLRQSNGEFPPLFINASDGKVQLETGTSPCEITILGGHIIVRIDSVPAGMSDDEVFRTTRHIVNAAVLTQTILQGVGLSYTVESLWRGTSDVMRAVPDSIPRTETIKINYKEVGDLIGGNTLLRYAARDFNQGLVYREDCPLLFYRAIETLAKLVCSKSEFEKLSPEDWDIFHKQIGTNYDDMKELHTIEKSHRHGTHSYFTRDQHLTMMKTADLFLIKTIRFLLKKGSKESGS